MGQVGDAQQCAVAAEDDDKIGKSRDVGFFKGGRFADNAGGFRIHENFSVSLAQPGYQLDQDFAADRRFLFAKDPDFFKKSQWISPSVYSAMGTRNITKFKKRRVLIMEEAERSETAEILRFDIFNPVFPLPLLVF